MAMTRNAYVDGDLNDSAECVDIRFSHIQLYVDSVCAVSEYKELETALNKFHDSFSKDNDVAVAEQVDIHQGQILWNSIQDASKDEEAFVPHGRDVVKVRDCQKLSN